MRHAIILTAITAVSLLNMRAQQNAETFDIISDSYTASVQDIELKRPLNGGTVISPVFDESCPGEMKGPFAYACKIVEEYMPPCLPLSVKVSCGSLEGASRNAISKISTLNKLGFGNNANCKNAPMSMIKSVILDEWSHGITASYLDYVPDISFLNGSPDISITYNRDRYDELCFSLETDPGEQYDFVTIAIRDLLKGLGLFHSYHSAPSSEGLQNPSLQMTPFESFIDKTLGSNGNPVERMDKATQGDLALYYKDTPKLKLYAPNPWDNEVSLNYFMPQSDCSVSNILSHDLCKGMVSRSLNDSYAAWIFQKLLGWATLEVPFTDGYVNPGNGSASLLMPYNGTITLFRANATYHSSTVTVLPGNDNLNIEDEPNPGRRELLSYVNSFHPFLHEADTDVNSGVSVSILKKDGTWDLVLFRNGYVPGSEVSVSNLNFHFDEEYYARTADGYLRARLTTKYKNDRRTTYNSKYFAVDYLPQKVSLAYSTPSSSENDADFTTMKTNLYPVRLYFSNLEGINRVVLERLREGFRLPSKIEVRDFKKGYFDTEIDRRTTFTAVGYNDNGHSRSVPVTINNPTASSGKPLMDDTQSTISCELSDNQINIKGDLDILTNSTYTIIALSKTGNYAELSGPLTEKIDISKLSQGIYLLTICNPSSKIIGSFKFKHND